MKKLIIVILFILQTFTVIYGQYSTRLFYGGYNGTSRIDLMEEYDKGDANFYTGYDIFSKPSDGKLFYHGLSGGYYYKGTVISDMDWDRLVVGLVKYNSSGIYVSNSAKLYQIGSSGYGSSNFKNPMAVAISYYDADEVCIYIADQINNRIQRCIFNLDNGATRLWSSLASNYVNYPADIEIDNKNDLTPSNDELWIADSRNNRIAQMNYSGSILHYYGTIKSGTEGGTAGNINNPKSLSLYRMLDEVYSHTIVVSDNGNNRLAVIDFDGTTFTETYSLPLNQPSSIACVQFDQTSNNVYAVDIYNSKIYKYVFSPDYIYEELKLCGEYGGYGTGNHQLKHPVAIHPIVPMETTPGYYRGANYVGIIEEWSDNSGFKVGYEGVDITDMVITVPSGQHKMSYDYKIPSGIGFITETIKSGTENLLKKTDNSIISSYHRDGVWYGDVNNQYLNPGTYTLETKIVSFWDNDDQKTVQNNFYIIPGGPFAPVPYSTSFGSSFDDYWSYSLGARTTNDHGPHTGSYHLVMSALIDIIPIYTTHSAILKLNFPSTQDQTELSFWWKDFGDENHSNDAVFFSSNAGNSWIKVHQFYPESNPDNTWNKITLDIDQLCQTYGLTQSNRFCIKFSQHDNQAVVHNDGIAIDDIQVAITSLKSTDSNVKENYPVFSDLPGKGFEYIKNYPNPFNSSTTFNYTLSEDSQVSLEIFDITGQKVITLVDAEQSKGNKNIYWDGTNEIGENAPAGMYFCRLIIFDNVKSGFSKTHTLVKVE